MARQKNDGKGRLGGRAKGTPNKATTDLKAWVSYIFDNGRDKFVNSLEQLEPNEYIRVFSSYVCNVKKHKSRDFIKFAS